MDERVGSLLDQCLLGQSLSEAYRRTSAHVCDPRVRIVFVLVLEKRSARYRGSTYGAFENATHMDLFSQRKTLGAQTCKTEGFRQIPASSVSADAYHGKTLGWHSCFRNSVGVCEHLKKSYYKGQYTTVKQRHFVEQPMNALEKERAS